MKLYEDGTFGGILEMFRSSRNRRGNLNFSVVDAQWHPLEGLYVWWRKGCENNVYGILLFLLLLLYVVRCYYCIVVCGVVCVIIVVYGVS